MPDYEILPPFDDELNKRLNAGIEPAEPKGKSIDELLEEARAEEREACAKIAKDCANVKFTNTATAALIAEQIRARGKVKEDGEEN